MSHIIGIDEVGTGALAGPAFVVACAVPVAWSAPKGLTDSKAMTASARERVNNLLLADVDVFVAYAAVSVEDIDQRGIRVALVAAIRFARISVERRLVSRSRRATRVIVDGNMEFGHGWESIPKADALFPCVSAASVLAKVHRDRHMCQLDEHPDYGFSKNMGYGTPSHLAAMRKHGLTEHHRRTFKPASEMVKK